MEVARDILVGAIIVVIALTVSFTEWNSGRKRGIEQMQKEAVAYGAASYVITDPATGAVEFRWREKP